MVYLVKKHLTSEQKEQRKKADSLARSVIEHGAERWARMSHEEREKEWQRIDAKVEEKLRNRTPEEEKESRASIRRYFLNRCAEDVFDAKYDQLSEDEKKIVEERVDKFLNTKIQIGKPLPPMYDSTPVAHIKESED